MSKDLETLQKELLKDRRVVDEINRHLWIESEKAGFDVGFENASRDWIERFSKAWVDYHKTEKKKKTVSSQKSKVKAKAKPSTKRPRK